MKKIIVLSFLLIGCAPEKEERKPSRAAIYNNHIDVIYTEKDNNVKDGWGETYGYWSIIQVDNEGVKSRFLYHHGFEGECMVPLPLPPEKSDKPALTPPTH